MDQCKTCRQELEPGYEYCHFCGTPVGAPVASAPAGGFVATVEAAHNFWGDVSKTLAEARRRVDHFLGDPISLQRQILTSLLAGFAVTAPLGVNPATYSIIGWIEAWLFISSLFFFPVRYWMTGVVPLSGVINAILGPDLSLRRRLILSFLLAGIPFLFVVTAASSFLPFDSSLSGGGFACFQSGIFFLFPYMGSWVISYYWMGFTGGWIPVWNCEYSLYCSSMRDKVFAVSEASRNHLRDRKIGNIEMTEVDMAKLRHQTAGRSGAEVGRQFSLISGRARVILFVQNFGDGMFVRWVGYYDRSGRRLWLMIGFFVGFINDLIGRWTGTTIIAMGSRWMQILLPVSRNQVLLDTSQRGWFVNMLGLVEGVSEYAWNELYALEATVRGAVVEAVCRVGDLHSKEAEIRALIEQHSRLERIAGRAGHPGPSSR